MIHFIADGCAFSFGVLYTELLDYFQESKGKTAWVGSLFVSVPLLAGPIASALTNKYGCRTITMIGALVASVGFIFGAFSTSTDMLCLTFGVISGFGLSMVYVPAVVIVAFYFEKKRAFATGRYDNYVKQGRKINPNLIVLYI
jgi:ERI1 exoribonuclease 2